MHVRCNFHHFAFVQCYILSLHSLSIHLHWLSISYLKTYKKEYVLLVFSYRRFVLWFSFFSSFLFVVFSFFFSFSFFHCLSVQSILQLKNWFIPIFRCACVLFFIPYHYFVVDRIRKGISIKRMEIFIGSPRWLKALFIYIDRPICIQLGLIFLNHYHSFVRSISFSSSSLFSSLPLYLRIT